jgi:DNA-binding NarL/FixJ family response regulator
LRVVIADDNRLMLEGFRRALERVEDIDVVGSTHSGDQLLSMIERRCPDLAVMDLQLRTCAGQRCLDVVHATHPGVKVVVLSATSAEGDIRSALSRGASAYIVTSINPLDIPSALRHSFDETVHHAFGFAPSPEDKLRAAGLTERELTMLRALACGMSNRAISQRLWLSEPTVKFHLGNLYRKLGVPNRLAAAHFAHNEGIAGDGVFEAA